MLTNRQEEIIEKSIDLISKKGIQGFTIKNLSKSVGISEPAIYRHFESKVKILSTLLDQFVEMAEFFSGMMQNSDMTAIEKIAFMFEKMVDLFTQNPAMIAIIFSEEIFKNEEELTKKTVGILNTNEKTIESILLKGQKNNEIRDDICEKTMALVVMGSLRLLVKRWDLNNHDFNLKEEGEKLIDSIRKLLTK